MTKFTAQIIMLCKQPENYLNSANAHTALSKFHAEYIGNPLDFYSTPAGVETLNQVIYEAMLDYVDSCDRPSSFVRMVASAYEFHRLINDKIDYITAIISAFKGVRIKDDNGKYINGFNEELSTIHNVEYF